VRFVLYMRAAVVTVARRCDDPSRDEGNVLQAVRSLLCACGACSGQAPRASSASEERATPTCAALIGYEDCIVRHVWQSGSSTLRERLRHALNLPVTSIREQNELDVMEQHVREAMAARAGVSPLRDAMNGGAVFWHLGLEDAPQPSLFSDTVICAPDWAVATARRWNAQLNAAVALDDVVGSRPCGELRCALPWPVWPECSIDAYLAPRDFHLVADVFRARARHERETDAQLLEHVAAWLVAVGLALQETDVGTDASFPLVHMATDTSVQCGRAALRRCLADNAPGAGPLSSQRLERLWHDVAKGENALYSALVAAGWQYALVGDASFFDGPLAWMPALTGNDL